MNVSELISKLSAFPPDMPVVVSGYERGFNDVATFSTVFLKLNQNDKWYYGRHSKVHKNDADITALEVGPNRNFNC